MGMAAFAPWAKDDDFDSLCQNVLAGDANALADISDKYPQQILSGKLLCRAAKAGRTDIAAYVLERGCSPDATDDSMGVTALMYAAANNAMDMAELLMRYNANVHAVDFSGSSALHYAALWNSPDVLRTLLIHGADGNGHGVSAAAKADKQGYAAIVDMIERADELRRSMAEQDARVLKDGLHQALPVNAARLVLSSPLRRK